ncbi:MAG: RIP metalloprotease RseP [Acidobacteria bacterium]|nr:RIP metalloprotease RseP [Acidobacteriota bacterium]
MPDILVVTLAVIFVLGVAINIHEFGHFIVAKILGMRVEAYSFFGLGPRVWGFKRGHTDYRISAIPLGAYVKLYGDEATSSLEGGASDGEVVPESELYELRPRWQKFLVMLGGPFMNIVLALAIPFGAAMIYGIPAMPAPVIGVVKANGAAEQAGIKPGDRIVAFDGIESPTFDRIRKDAAISPDKEVAIVIERDGKRLPLTIKPSRTMVNGNGIGELDFDPDMGAEPVVVDRVVENMPAAQSGLQKGDMITAVNGKLVRNRMEVRNAIVEAKDQPIAMSITRNNEPKEITTTAKQTPEGAWQIGIAFGNSVDAVRDPATIGSAANFAVTQNLDILRLTGRVFGQLFSGERSVRDAGLAGPVGIVQIIAQVVREAGIAGLFSILAVISLNLGVFNLLPIPLLDGGQIMVLGIEKVLSWFGKTMSMAFREKIQLAGLAIIVLLMIFTMVLDISRFF